MNTFIQKAQIKLGAATYALLSLGVVAAGVYTAVVTFPVVPMVIFGVLCASIGALGTRVGVKLFTGSAEKKTEQKKEEKKETAPTVANPAVEAAPAPVAAAPTEAYNDAAAAPKPVVVATPTDGAPTIVAAEPAKKIPVL